jgi:transposase-like protein
MTITKQKRSATFKRRVAIEALREQKTANQIAKEFDVHPVQVSQWKKELLAGADSVFETKKNNARLKKEMAEEKAALQQKVGQLTIEIDWLKKKLNLSP